MGSVIFDQVPSCWLCLLFFQEGTGLISLSDWSWRLLLHGDVWLLNSISRNDRSGKITGFFCIVCSFCAFLVKKSWMQLNTDRKKACLLKDFFLDIFQNVGFVCFRMCWRIFNDIVVTVGSSGSASGIAIGNYLTGSKLKYALNRNIDVFFVDCVGGLEKKVFVSRS